MARKLPTRPTAEISQNFNGGVVQVFSTGDAAQPGRQPLIRLTPKVTLRYEEKRLGINRLYLSRENMAEIVRVIRVPRSAVTISSQDVAQTEDGQKYRIDTVQAVEDCWPPALDLSLRAVEADFDRRLEDDSNGVV